MEATGVGPGTVLAGRYRIVDMLGRGASADVWRCWDQRLARTVALKVFRAPASEELDSRERRTAEAQLLAGLSHPNLVAVYDACGFDDRDGVGWIAMELVAGRTLRAALEDGPLPPPVVADIGRQLAEVLCYVHRRGAVHRDVKPANVLLTRGDPDDGIDSDPRGALVVKLTDFGVARLLDAARMTSEGATVGTANYLSPEQVTGARLGPEVDVYALGLVLLEALTGQLAYPGFGVEAAVARLHRPVAIPAALGPEWRDLLSRMTAADPVHRPHPREVSATLSRLRTGDGKAPGATTLAEFPADTAATLVPGLHAADTASTTTVRTRAPRKHDGRRRRTVPLLVGSAVAAVAAAVIVPLLVGGGPRAADAQPASGTGVQSGTHHVAVGRTSPSSGPDRGASRGAARQLDARDMRAVRGSSAALLVEHPHRHGTHQATRHPHRGARHHQAVPPPAHHRPAHAPAAHRAKPQKPQKPQKAPKHGTAPAKALHGHAPASKH